MSYIAGGTLCGAGAACLALHDAHLAVIARLQGGHRGGSAVRKTVTIRHRVFLAGLADPGRQVEDLHVHPVGSAVVVDVIDGITGVIGRAGHVEDEPAGLVYSEVEAINAEELPVAAMIPLHGGYVDLGERVGLREPEREVIVDEDEGAVHFVDDGVDHYNVGIVLPLGLELVAQVDGAIGMGVLQLRRDLHVAVLASGGYIHAPYHRDQNMVFVRADPRHRFELVGLFPRPCLAGVG